MLRELVKIANKLDFLGLTKEADIIDSEILKLASEDVFQKLGAAVDDLISMVGSDASYKRYVYVNHGYSIDEGEDVSDLASYIKSAAKLAEITDKDLKEKVLSLKRLLNKEKNKIPPSSIEGSKLNSYDEKWEEERVRISSGASPEANEAVPTSDAEIISEEPKLKAEPPPSRREEETEEGLNARQKELRLMRKFLQFLYERNEGDRRDYIRKLSHENALKFVDFFIQRKNEFIERNIFDGQMLLDIIQKIDPRGHDDFLREIKTFLEEDREGVKPRILFNKYPESLMRFWKALSPEMKEMLRQPTSGGTFSVFQEGYNEPISYIERDKSNIDIEMAGRNKKPYEPSPMSEEEREEFRIKNEEKLKGFFERLRERELKREKKKIQVEDPITTINDLKKFPNMNKYYIFRINFKVMSNGTINYRKPFYQIVDIEGKDRAEARAEAIRLTEEFDRAHPKFIERFPELDPFKYIKGQDAYEAGLHGDIPHVISTSNINAMNSKEFDTAFGEEIIPEQDLGLPEGTYETTEEDMEAVLNEDEQ